MTKKWTRKLSVENSSLGCLLKLEISVGNINNASNFVWIGCILIFFTASARNRTLVLPDRFERVRKEVFLQQTSRTLATITTPLTASHVHV